MHKTRTAFTNPVDPLLGQAIEAWQALRPPQPAALDHKTNEHVTAVRTHPVAKIGTTPLHLSIFIPSVDNTNIDLDHDGPLASKVIDPPKCSARPVGYAINQS